VVAGLDDHVTGRIRHRSPTARLRLRGAEGYDEARRAGVAGLTTTQVEQLADRFGGEAATVHALIAADPSLAEPLVPGLPYLRAEAVYAVRYEMARGLDDVLDRRTRARLLARDATAGAAGEVAALIGPELGWSSQQQQTATAAYRATLTHEREAADLPATALDAALGA